MGRCAVESYRPSGSAPLILDVAEVDRVCPSTGIEVELDLERAWIGPFSIVGGRFCMGAGTRNRWSYHRRDIPRIGAYRVAVSRTGSRS